MKSNGLKLLSALFILLMCNVYNYKIYSDIKRQSYANEKMQKKYENLSENKVKKYTYSDIIEFVEENRDFSIVNINKDRNNNTNVELNFKSGIKPFISFINSTKNKDKFIDIIFLNLKRDNNKNIITGNLKLRL